MPLVRVVLAGVRGSTPAPGAEFDRYGGHTSCVAVAADGAAPTLLLDAGTGVRTVSALLGGRPFVGSVLLTHLHWDHWQGIPFFAPAFAEGARVSVSAPRQPGEPAEVLAGMMRPPYFPIRFAGLGPGWSLRWRDEGTTEVEGFTVTGREIPHKGGRCFGYRVSDGTATLAYITDHGPTGYGPGPDGLGPLHAAALELADGADLLIHDAQHTAAEFPRLAYLGHATAEYAVRLGAVAGVGRVVLFHHDPARTDDELAAIVASCQAGAPMPVEAAVQGRAYELSPAAS